jgi:hypothetical protein
MSVYLSCSSCLIHILNRIKKETIYSFKINGDIIYLITCDYCSKSDFSNGNTIRIAYAKNNIVFELDFHINCFDIFSKLNQLQFCNNCLHFYSCSTSSSTSSSTCENICGKCVYGNRNDDV